MTINLKTGREYPPDPLDYITKVAGTELAPPGTLCPLWLRFLQRVTANSEEIIAFLQRFLGYCMTGEITEHVLVFLFGTGANGKGVFTATITEIMGTYAVIAPMEMFVVSRGERHPTEIAKLRGARLVLAHETQKGRIWDESKLKTLTGGDKLTGRFMRGDFFDFKPTHKFLIEGNHKPSFSSIDEAIRRRVLLVPFTVYIPEKDRDPKLIEKLRPEHPAILRWMVEGCAEWMKNGLMVPASVRLATEEYLTDQDSLRQWCDECLEPDKSMNAFVSTRDLFKSWRGWCEDRNLSPGTETAFADSLKDRGYERKRTNKAKGFNGIKLRSTDTTGTLWEGTGPETGPLG